MPPRIETSAALQLTTDVLVLGGGPAAAWAAWAASAGARVIVADKGYLGTSGSAAASGNGVLAVPPDEHAAVIAARAQSLPVDEAALQRDGRLGE